MDQVSLRAAHTVPTRATVLPVYENQGSNEMRCNVQKDLDDHLEELSRLERAQDAILDQAKDHFLDCKIVQALLRTERGNEFQAFFDGLSPKQLEDSLSWKWQEVVMEWLEENE
jgi:hypothetical protein